MSACVKKDRKQKTIDENSNSPSAAMNSSETFTIDFNETAFRSIATTANDSERIVTALCSGRVGFAFDGRYQLESITATLDQVKFESTSSLDDYVKIGVRGFVTSEEGNNTFATLWPSPLRPKDFKGPGPFELTHYERKTVCGQRLTLRIDQMEAQARRAAEPKSSNQFGVPRLVFRFVPCQR